MENVIGGNARVSVQGNVRGSIRVSGDRVTRTSRCGCPGNDTTTYPGDGTARCTRCGAAH